MTTKLRKGKSADTEVESTETDSEIVAELDAGLADELEHKADAQAEPEQLPLPGAEGLMRPRLTENVEQKFEHPGTDNMSRIEETP